MFKKASVAVLSLGLLLAVAVPAFAWYTPSVNMNVADVSSYTESNAISGQNSQSSIAQVEKASYVIALSGQAMGSRSIVSGAANSTANSLNIVNGSMGHSYGSNMNMAKVSSGAVSGALSGGNMQDQVTTVTKAHHVAAGAITLGGTSTIHTGVSTSTVNSRNLVNVRVSW